jgi:hypothetical protein
MLGPSEVVGYFRCSVKGAGLAVVQVMITKIESSTELARVKSGATVDDTNFALWYLMNSTSYLLG